MVTSPEIAVISPSGEFCETNFHSLTEICTHSNIVIINFGSDKFQMGRSATCRLSLEKSSLLASRKMTAQIPGLASQCWLTCLVGTGGAWHAMINSGNSLTADQDSDQKSLTTGAKLVV